MSNHGRCVNSSWKTFYKLHRFGSGIQIYCQTLLATPLEIRVEILRTKSRLSKGVSSKSTKEYKPKQRSQGQEVGCIV
jgi:hypothetical protein